MTELPVPGLPRVALIDDDVDLLAGLRRALRGLTPGWEISFHSQPLQALAALRQQPCDVAVVDIRMPELNGVQLAAALAEDCPQTLCIVLSGSTDFDLAVNSINVGRIFRYLVKPCPTPVLVDAISAALAHRAGTSQAASQGEMSARVAIDQMRCGVVVVGPRGQVLFTNQRAGSLLSRRDGVLVDNAGICRGSSAEETNRLHVAIRDARDQGLAGALSLQTQRHGVLRVVVRPGRPDLGTSGQSICLYLFAEDDSFGADPQLLRGMFGLTASESRLAAALAEGLSLEDAAAAEGWTVNSARSYLRTIFQKMGVSRQADLVRMVLSHGVL